MTLFRTEVEAWDDHFRNVQGIDIYNHPDFIADELDDQIDGVGDSLLTGAKNAGIITGGIRALHDMVQYDVSDEPDPNYNIFALIDNDEFLKNVVQRADESGSVYDQKFVQALLATKNESQFEQAFRVYGRDLEALEAHEENPWMHGLGTILGFAPDIGVSLLAPLALGPIVAANAARLTGAGLALRSAAAARAVGAGRIGAFGAGEGLGETYVQDLTRTMLVDDYLWNTLMGGLVGGLLGGIAPTVIARVGVDWEKWRADKIRVTTREQAEAEARRESDFVGDAESVGAQRSPQAEQVAQDLDLEIAATSLGPLGVINRRLRRTMGRGFAVISPKTMIAQWFELARTLKGTKSGAAIERLANITGRMFQPNVVFRHQLAGAEGRVLTMTDLLNAMDAFRVSRQMEVGEQTREMYKILEDEFGLSAKGRMVSDTADTIARKFDIGDEAMPGMEDLWRLADQIAHMKRLNEERLAREVAEGDEPPALITEDQVWNSVEKFRGLPQEVRSPIWDLADKISKTDDDFYKAFEDRLVAGGLMDAPDVIAHYRSQLWDSDRVAMNGPRFERMIYRVLEKEPEQEWVNEHFFREAAEEGAPASGKFWDDNETWTEVANRDPEMAREILEEWGFEVKRRHVASAVARKESIEDFIRDQQFEDAAEMERKWGADIDKWTRLIARDDSKIKKLQREKLKDPTLNIDTEVVRLLKLNQGRMHKLEQKRKLMDLIQENFENIEEISALQRRFRTPNRQKTNEALKKLRKTEKRVAAQEARKTINETIKELRASIGTGSGARVSDLPMDRMRSGNSRLMRRMLNLQDEQFSEDAAFFLRAPSEVKMTQYVHTIGRRLSFIEALGPYLRKLDPTIKLDGTNADIELLNKLMHDAFADAKEGADAATVRMLKREEEKARTFIKEQLEGWNNIGITDDRLNGWMEVILGGTAANALGSVVLTQATDIPTAMLAMPGNAPAGRFMASLASNFGRTNKALRESMEQIKQEDFMVYSVMRGLNAYETMRWEKMVDTRSVSDQVADAHSGATTGGLGFARSATRELGKVQAYVSLAPQWNRWVQTSFGHVFMDSLNDGIMHWDNLKAIDKEHFARLGIGERQARKMAKALADDNMTKGFGPGNRLRIPIKDQWDDELYGQWLGVMIRGQNEALISPEFGDMPALVMRHPLARLIYQFSSFAFAWGGQVAKKAVQRGVMHPSDIKRHAPLLMGIAFGTMVMAMKNTIIYGKSWDETWDREPAELAWDIMSRTPYVTGMGNTLTENFFTLFGSSINTAAGMNILPQESNYFKRGQGLASLAGPAVGILQGTYVNAAMQAADGDYEKAFDRVAVQLPIANTVGARALMNLFGEE